MLLAFWMWTFGLSSSVVPTRWCSRKCMFWLAMWVPQIFWNRALDHLRALLMLYIAKGKASFSWKKAGKQDPDAVLRYSLLLNKLQTSHQRGTAPAILDPWLRARGFCGTKSMRILVSHRALIDVATQRVRENVAKISKGNKLYQRWFISRFQVCVGKPPLFSDKWNRSRISKTGSLPEPIALDMLTWLPMRRVERNWKVEERLTPRRLQMTCANASSELMFASKTKAFHSVLTHGKVESHKFCSEGGRVMLALLTSIMNILLHFAPLIWVTLLPYLMTNTKRLPGLWTAVHISRSFQALCLQQPPGQLQCFALRKQTLGLLECFAEYWEKRWPKNWVWHQKAF